jgi:DNA-binding transcriptional regulator YiaG
MCFRRKSVNKILRDIRRGLGLTQAALASAAHINRSVLAEWEMGRRYKLSPERVALLADKLQEQQGLRLMRIVELSKSAKEAREIAAKEIAENV